MNPILLAILLVGGIGLIAGAGLAIASVLMGFVGYYAQKLGAGLIGDAKATALAVCLAAAVYGVVMLAIGGISEKDILMLPKGQTMVRLLKKMHLLHTKPAQ